jgi:hypothetical protein
LPASCCGVFTQDLDSAGDGQATLILQVPSIDANGQAIPASFDHIIYSFNLGGQTTAALQRDVRVATGSLRLATPRVAARHISDVAFDLSVPEEVTVIFRGAKREGGRDYDLKLVSRSVLRN